ncbi:transposase, partial [Myroides odoratimimus]|uniref:transposase n=1 Tax=Myroides odoratimimus TaxID=76832 RepID=UPI0038D4DAA4
LKHFLETMLESELENHLEEEKAKGIPNRRNGETTKTVRSMQSGSIELESNRDRNGTFPRCNNHLKSVVTRLSVTNIFNYIDIFNLTIP